MTLVVTAAGTISCIHAGTAAPVPGQQKLTVAGSPVLVGADLAGTPIGATCTNKPTPALPGNVQCTLTTGVPAGASTVLTVDGGGVLLKDAGGATNSVPPGTWTVTQPGQALVTVAR
jgi:hypothetical protein